MGISSKHSSIAKKLIAPNLGELWISEWLITETHSALGLLVRSKALSDKNASDLLDMFSRHRSKGVYRTLEIKSEHFRLANQYLLDFAQAIRAGDALHIALCSSYKLKLLTFDKQQADVAYSVGVETVSTNF